MDGSVMVEGVGGVVVDGGVTVEGVGGVVVEGVTVDDGVGGVAMDGGGGVAPGVVEGGDEVLAPSIP